MLALDIGHPREAFKELLHHRGHRIACVTYGATDENVALECVDCSTVLLDYDAEDVGATNDYIEALLGGRTSDELHEDVVRRREGLEDEIRRRRGSELEYETAQAVARKRHTKIERAVDWIEAHPEAGGV